MSVRVAEIPAPGAAATWEFEVVPLLQLPSVDLADSVKAHLPSNRILHSVLKAFIRSPVTIIAYSVSLVFGVVPYFVPPHIGRPLAVVGFLLSLPGTMSGVVMLRYDLVMVLLKTYDIWFFGTVSAAVAVLLALLMCDARSSLALFSYLSFSVNIFIDAHTIDARYLWITNIAAVMCYLAMAGAIGFEVTSDLCIFDIVRLNGHALSATTVVRDGILIMVVVILRNIVRRRIPFVNHAGNEEEQGSEIVSSVTKCVSFRCRLQLQAVTPGQRRRGFTAVPASPMLRGSPGGVGVSMASTVMTKLRFVQFLPIIDAHSTVAPLPGAFWIHPPTPTTLNTGCWQLVFKLIGLYGLLAPSLLILLALWVPSTANHRGGAIVSIAALVAAFLFMGACIASCQRVLARTAMSSFDFAYIVIQLTILHLAAAMLWRWQLSILLALLTTWGWGVWLFFWDALMPCMRARLGLPTRLAAWVCTVLMVLMGCISSTMFVLRSPRELNDRPIVRFTIVGHLVEFRALAWYFSCAVNIATYVIRMLWRFWHAIPGELVAIDGPVVYDLPTQFDKRQRPERPAQKTMMLVEPVLPRGPTEDLRPDR